MSIFERATSDSSPFPPAELFSEGWMLRLLLDAHTQGQGGLPIPNVDGTRWYSEARLSSPFQPSRRGDPNGEGITHADGVVGDFLIRQDTTAGFEVAAGARQFVVVEAKMGSKLAAGTTRVPWYDQAVRNVGAMAWNLYERRSALVSIESLEFMVIAPESRIEHEGSFARNTQAASIAEKLTWRVNLYESDDPARFQRLGEFLAWTLGPFMDALTIRLCSWESAIGNLMRPCLPATRASIANVSSTTSSTFNESHDMKRAYRLVGGHASWSGPETGQNAPLLFTRRGCSLWITYNGVLTTL